MVTQGTTSWSHIGTTRKSGNRLSSARKSLIYMDAPGRSSPKVADWCRTRVVSETGTDMAKFPSDKHFASWLGLCPGTKITGGKVMSSKTKPCANRAAQALRLAAAALRTSQSALGAYYRRMCARMDKAKAVTAAAHKLARLIYTMLTKGEEYTDQGQAYYEERYRQRVLHNLNRRAQQLGMTLVAAQPAPQRP